MGCGFSKPSKEDIDFNKKIKPEMKTLNNGLKCPIIGLGTALIKDKEHIDVVYQSIKNGVRLIDTEPANEEFVGEGIKRVLDEGQIRREELFIVTKLELEEKENPEEALRKSLERLQLNNVDLYLDHWPSCIDIKEPNKKPIPVKDTWQKMENLVDLGLTKSIGLSNYNVENMLNVLSICRIKPVVNEVEFHPYLYQKDLKEFCDKENIILFAYNPLVRGKYCDREFIRLRCLDPFRDGPITRLFDKYQNKKITRGQIILNWHLCLGVVPIPGTSRPERMKENLGAKNFVINRINVENIGSNEERQHRFCDGFKIFGIDIFA